MSTHGRLDDDADDDDCDSENEMKIFAPSMPDTRNGMSHGMVPAPLCQTQRHDTAGKMT